MRDILFTADGDIKWENGDVQFGESTQQHMRDLLLAKKHEYAVTPGVTVGVDAYLHDENPDDLAGEIRRKYMADGIIITGINLLDGKGRIDGYYQQDI